MEYEYEFEQLIPTLEGVRAEGMMIDGTAILVSDETSEDPHMFFVAEVVIKGGFRLTRSGAGICGFPSPFRKVLYRAIADVIEDDQTKIGEHAQACFSEHVTSDGDQFLQAAE